MAGQQNSLFGFPTGNFVQAEMRFTCGKSRAVWISIAAAVAMASPGHPSAQDQAKGCTEASHKASFVLTDTNRISAEQFSSVLIGRSIEYVRPHDRQSIDMRYVRHFRQDGSQSATCEYRQRRGDMSWYPCSKVGDNVGGRVIAVWRVADKKGIICEKAIQLKNEQESCYSFHRQSGQMAVKHISGPWVCMAGDIVVK